MGEPLIDEDIRTAQTLPSAWYTEMEHFNRLKSVFSGWQFAAHQSDFGANNVLPVEHYEAITSESVVLLKGEKTACHSNVCTHRGMRVALEACTVKNPAMQVPRADLQLGWDTETHAGIRRGHWISYSER